MPASTGLATWEETSRQAQTWSNEVLACRTRGHSWEQWDSAKEGRGYVIYFICTRGCDVRKTQRWDRRGNVLKTSTTYPKDADGRPSYLSPMGRIDAEAKGALRIATLDRAVKRPRRKLAAVK